MPAVPLLALLACLLAAPAARSVVHTTGDGSGNTAPPPDDPGFANVGVSETGNSGVYLGNRWVLTAAHVGERAFEFGGVVYHPQIGSRRRIKENGTNTDLAMVRLTNPAPPLPAPVLSSATPAIGDGVVVVGNGWSREATLTCWDGAWSEVTCPAGAFEGYERSGPRVMRWGRNEVSAIGTDLMIGNSVTRAFEIDFDEAGVADEAQLVNGDSGGAAFLKRGDTWELVGIHNAMVAFMGQPNETAVFGNAGISGDVFHYREQIEDILATPETVPALPAPALLVLAAALAGVARRSLPLA